MVLKVTCCLNDVTGADIVLAFRYEKVKLFYQTQKFKITPKSPKGDFNTK